MRFVSLLVFLYVLFLLTHAPRGRAAAGPGWAHEPPPGWPIAPLDLRARLSLQAATHELCAPALEKAAAFVASGVKIGGPRDDALVYSLCHYMQSCDFLAQTRVVNFTYFNEFATFSAMLYGYHQDDIGEEDARALRAALVPARGAAESAAGFGGALVHLFAQAYARRSEGVRYRTRGGGARSAVGRFFRSFFADALYFSDREFSRVGGCYHCTGYHEVQDDAVRADAHGTVWWEGALKDALDHSGRACDASARTERVCAGMLRVLLALWRRPPAGDPWHRAGASAAMIVDYALERHRGLADYLVARRERLCAIAEFAFEGPGGRPLDDAALRLGPLRGACLGLAEAVEAEMRARLIIY